VALSPATRPEPKPAIDKRPLSISITDAESLLRDPYSFYVRRILRLNRLNRIAEPAMAAELGTAIHAALETFIKDGPFLGPEGRKRLFEGLIAQLQNLRFDSGILGLKRPLMQSLANRFVEHEEGLRRSGNFKSLVEQKGEAGFEIGRGIVKIRGKFDRIDIYDDHSLIVRDYKTGTVPSKTDVAEGRSPQLSLTAAMALKGAFLDLGAHDYQIKQISYLKVSPQLVKESICNPNDRDIHEFIDEIWQIVCDRILEFENPERAYLPWREKNPYAPTDEIDHLARRFEWSVELEEAVDEEEGPV